MRKLWALTAAVTLLTVACGATDPVTCEGRVAPRTAGTPNGSETADPLVDVESYRYTATLQTTFRNDAGPTVLDVDVETVGAFVAPTSHEASSRIRYEGTGRLFLPGTQTFIGEAVATGDQAWVKRNIGRFNQEGQWVEATRSAVGDVPIDLSTFQADLFPPVIEQLIRTADGFPASYKGRPVTKYELEAIQPEHLSNFVRSSLVEQIESTCIGIWVDHDTGTIAAYGFEGTGTTRTPEPGAEVFPAQFSLLIEFSDVNSSSIIIDPPPAFITNEEFTG